jgi:hypothetical protein
MDQRFHRLAPDGATDLLEAFRSDSASEEMMVAKMLHGAATNFRNR